MNVKTSILTLAYGLQAFALNTNTTTLSELSPGMVKTYSQELLKNIQEKQVFNQFGVVKDLPKGGGNTINFRKFDAYEPATTPLVEGETPNGHKLVERSIECTIAQYGDYTTLSDRLQMEHFDPVISEATRNHSNQATKTLEIITRNAVIAGTNVMYAPKVSGDTVTEITSRSDITAECLLTPRLVSKVNTKLTMFGAPEEKDGGYIGIIHPAVAEDIRNSKDWIEFHKYASVKQIFNGEIGELHNCRFIVNNNAKVIAPDIISDGYNRLTVKTAISSSTNSIVINELLTSTTPSEAIPVYIDGKENTITNISTSGSVTTLTVGKAITSLAAGKTVCGRGAGKDGSAIYISVFFGAEAYARINPSAESLEVFAKPLGSAGTADPLNQRSTVGWKACHAAKILYNDRLVRVESGSSYSAVGMSN